MKTNYAPSNKFFDWFFVLFAGVWTAGAYVDGYAHVHVGAGIESFFTPWHFLFYAGMASTAILLFATLYLNHKNGFAWRKSLPREYMFSFWGIVIAMTGGAGDIAWHTLFGIEAGIEALLSPTHLLLAVGGAVAVSGPLHAIWHRDRKVHRLHSWPVLLSFSYVFLLITFMLQFLHPFNFPWLAESFILENPIERDVAGGLGVANLIVFTAIFMGLILSTVRHWVFPKGAFTVVLFLSALAITLLHGEYFWFIISALVSGVIIDILYFWLTPLVAKESNLRLFSFLTPVVIAASYVITLMLTDSVWWSVHMWAGAIVLTGIVGYLFTYLLLPAGEGRAGAS